MVVVVVASSADLCKIRLSQFSVIEAKKKSTVELVVQIDWHGYVILTREACKSGEEVRKKQHKKTIMMKWK